MSRHRRTPPGQELLFGDAVAVDYVDAPYAASRVMMSSESEHWCTDTATLEIIKGFGPIGFDPFSNPGSLVGAARSVCLPEDSLLMDWPLGEIVYCNPPYGRALGACAGKIGEQARRGCEILTLVPVRVDTAWWQNGMRPDMWLAWRRRLRFLEREADFLARHQKRVEDFVKAGRRPPTLPKYTRVGNNLVRTDPAPFAAALCYHGQRKDRFRETFAPHGRIYEETR